MTVAMRLLVGTSCAAIAVRAVRYAWLHPPAAVEKLLTEAMVLLQQSFLWTWAYSFSLALPAAALLLVAAVVFRRSVVEGWRGPVVPAALRLAGLTLLAAVNFLLDLNPVVGLLALATVLLTQGPSTPAKRSRWWLFAPPVVLVANLVLASDWADGAVLSLWVLVCAGLSRLCLQRADRLLLGGLGACSVGLLAAVLPLIVPLHGGRVLGEGLAYDFCEVESPAWIVASRPSCSWVPSVFGGFRACEEGGLVAYDRGSLEEVAHLNLFSEDHYGRFEQLLCVEDEVYASMQGTTMAGKLLAQAAMRIDPDRPETSTPNLVGAGLGSNSAYDAKRDAVVFTGEYTHRLARYRRADGVVEIGGESLRRDWRQPVSRRRYTGSLDTHRRAVHPPRDRLYVAEWLQGRDLFGVDLATLEVAERFRVGDGGSLGTAVDVEHDRLYSAAFWGLTAIDLGEGRVMSRIRLGLANKPPVFDAERGLLFVSSSVEGKIRAFDRSTLEPRFQIPIGFGVRNLYITRDGRWLLASSWRRQFAFDLEQLGRD